MANTKTDNTDEVSVKFGVEENKKHTPQSLNVEEIAEYIYKILYILGIQTIRKCEKLFKAMSKAFQKSKANFVLFCVDFVKSAKKYYCNLKTKFVSNAQDVAQNYSRLKRYKENDEKLGDIVYDILLPLRRISSYVLPVCAIVVLAFTISYYKNLTYALSVEYNGQNIGYISDEVVFNIAESDVKSRFVGEKYLQPENKIPIFTLEVIDQQELSTSDEIADKIIMASGNEIKQAEGLYIDGKFIGATVDGGGLLLALDDYKSDYQRENPNQQVSFVNQIEVKKGVYPVAQIVDLGEIERTIHSQVKGATTYKIKAGDSPTLVAQNMGIPTAELVARNPEVAKTFIVGQELLISQSQNYLTLKGTERITYEEDIDFGTEKVEDSSLYEGVSRVVKSGVDGVAEVVADVTYVDGIEQTRTILGTKVIKEPKDQVVAVGTKKPTQYIPTNTSGKAFMWPVDGGRVTCRIWGYPGHTGMDIGANYGTPVRASTGGRVVYAGWNSTGYGYMVMIDHGGGVQTLYAHNSSLDVSVGQYVEQGQVIARVGRTGRASGNHCHFEVRMNGRFVDPGIYVGYSYNR